jgi:phthalate 4,5-cis-dihydrodiol dehydrogenase
VTTGSEGAATRVLRIGVIGLGRAFSLMLPTFTSDPRVRLVAAADPRPEARARFAADFGGATFQYGSSLCRDADVDVVYVASPHQLHAEHAVRAAEAGRHVLVEKPMAVSLGDARRMVDAAARAQVALIVGHSHSFDLPILHTRRLIASGRFGRVCMISAQQYTDYLYRPRRPEELVTAQGGGVLFSQAAHQVDIARLLAGGVATRVTARAGAWDRARATEGAYAAVLDFAHGAFASLVYNGYGRFDTDELCGDIGELGDARDPDRPGGARRQLAAIADAGAETARKMARNYGGAAFAASAAAPRWHEHFGMVVVSCEGADLRPLPTGVMIYGDERPTLDPLPRPVVPRVEVIDELYAAVAQGAAPQHDGAWGLATLEACLAMLQSARDGGSVSLAHQCPWRDRP